MLWTAIEGCNPDRLSVGCTRQVSNTAGALWSSGGVVHCTYLYFFTTQYGVLLLSSHVAAYSDRISSPASKKSYWATLNLWVRIMRYFHIFKTSEYSSFGIFLFFCTLRIRSYSRILFSINISRKSNI
jgi:hypothetical protein